MINKRAAHEGSVLPAITKIGEPTPISAREEHLALSSLAKKFGYSEKRLRTLLQEGKIQGTLVGTLWISTASAVMKYQDQTSQRKKR